MDDPTVTDRKARKRFGALEIDSWIDSKLYEWGHSSGHTYERITIFMRRFKVTGFKRVLNEVATEGLTLAVVGGLVALALAVPSFEAAKKDWRTQGEYSVTFFDRYGAEIGRRGVLHNDAFELEELPDHLIQAVLATEDRRFFEHFGIDVFGTSRALMENARAGGVVQGGSSLSQQLAKNLFLSNERTLQRKIKEAYLALWLEANLTKREILKLYLDRAYMGGGTTGVAAASEFYFGKPATEVTLAESAMLAGLFKAPTRYAPHIDLPAARARANEVLTNMVQAGFVTEGQVVGARRNPANIVQRNLVSSPDYFLDWAFEEVKRRTEGADKVLSVRTTIDMRLQKAAEMAVETSLRDSGEAYDVNEAALVSIDMEGGVRAMVGGRDYGESTFNRATSAKRQPGSSFKPYVYATALENGYTPESVVADAPVSIGNWSPQNYTRKYSGRITLKTALAKSINTVPVRLSINMGRQPIADMAARLGVSTPLTVTRALALGPAEVTVLDMATGYAPFANGGFRVEPTGIIRILDSKGDVIYDRSTQGTAPERVLNEDTVLGMVEMLNAVVEAGTGRRAKLAGIHVAGKTGTTQAYRDAWFVGFTGNLSTAVWFGNDDFVSTEKMTGGTLPAETWAKFMRVAHLNADVKPLPGLPEPAEPRETVIADAQAQGALGGEAASLAQLSAGAAETLDRLATRFRAASAPQPQVRREAALNQPTTSLDGPGFGEADLPLRR